MKEKAFAKEYIANGGIGYKAALKAYNAKDINSANQIAIENLQKLTIVEMMDKVAGLRKEDRLKIMANGLYATKYNDFTGEETPDHQSIYRYLRLSFELDGELKAGQTINNTQNNITVSPILGGISKDPDVLPHNSN